MAKSIADLSKKHLSHLSRQPFKSSIEHFLKTGTINGSFLSALEDLCKEVRQEVIEASGKLCKAINEQESMKK